MCFVCMYFAWVCERIAVLAGSGIKRPPQNDSLKMPRETSSPNQKKHQKICKGRKRGKIVNSSVKTVMRPKRHSSGNESIYQLQYAKNKEGNKV